MKGVARKKEGVPDLLIETTEDDISNIPAEKVNVESTVVPTARVVPPQRFPVPDDQEKVLEAISRLLEGMGLCAA